jgi:TolB-like protein
MPFANLSASPDQEYFADGVTDEIINQLSRNRWLLVVSRNSSFAWKGRTVDAREIGEALGARYIVEGSVRRAGERVRIAAQLVSSIDGTNIWAGRYDRNVADIFDIQDEVAEAIAAAIEPELGDVEREIAHRKPPGNLSAWEWYLRGSWHLYRFTPADLAEAERLFGRAIALDPGLARAHAGLAYVFIQEAFYGDPAERQSTLDAAQASAVRSVACDDRDAMSHFALGRALSLRRHYDEAVLELETALELSPGFAQAWFALGFCLAWSGRPAEALPLLEKAALLSPRDPHLWTFHHLSAMSCFILGRFDEATTFIRKAVRPANATYWPFVTQVAIAGMRMDSAEIVKARETLLARRPDYSISMLREDLFFAAVPRDVELFAEGLRRAGLPEPKDT